MMSRKFRLALRWLAVLVVCVAFDAVTAAPPKVFQISSEKRVLSGNLGNTLCGVKNADGTIECLGGRVIPFSTFTAVEKIFPVGGGFCVYGDKRFACWGEHNEVNPEQSLSRFQGQIERVLSYGYNTICVLVSDGRIICLGSRFRSSGSFRDGMAQFLPHEVSGLKSLGMHFSGTPCGINVTGLLECLTPPLGVEIKLPEKMPADELLTHDHRTCVRSGTTVRCFGYIAESTLFPPASIPADATDLSLDDTFLCWLNKGQIDCSSLDYANTSAVFTQLPKTATDIRKYDLDYSYGCYLNSLGAISCWGDLGDLEIPDDIGEGWENVYIAYAMICLSRSAELRCFGTKDTPASNLNTPLFASKDLRVVIGPEMACASGGGQSRCLIGGTSLPPALTLKHPTVVTATSGSQACALDGDTADPASDGVSVKCWTQKAGWHERADFDPGAKLLAANARYVCAGYDDLLRCGDGAAEFRTELRNAKKIVMGPRHVCALDDFGIGCWILPEMSGDGEDQVPGELQAPGSAVDVVTTRGSTCGLTASGTVSCWGPYAPYETPTSLKNPTSLFAYDHSICATHDEGISCWRQP